MTTLEDFIDTSDIDFEPPPELREQINETLVELNSDLYGEDDGNGGTIGNPPKLLRIDVIDRPGATYEFEAVANDAEDTDSQLSYEWQVDGTVVGDDSSRLTRAFQSEGDVDVTATVTDTDGNSNSRTKTVTVELPDPVDRFSVDTFKFVDGNGDPVQPGRPADIKYEVSDADGDDDVLVLRITFGFSTTPTDQDKGAVETLGGTFFSRTDDPETYDVKLEAMDEDLYNGDPIDDNGNLPDGSNFTGGYAENNGSFVTLRDVTYTITD